MSGEKFTDIEAARAVRETIEHATAYPLGEPMPIAVTLTDEEWVAVKAVLQVGLIIQSTGDMQYMPNDMAQRAHDAWHGMHEQIKEVLGTIAENSKREEGLG